MRRSLLALFVPVAVCLLQVEQLFASTPDKVFRKFPLKELVKTEQDPASVRRLEDGTVLADFGKAAFGQLTLGVSVPAGAELKVRLGEKAADGRIDRKPGGTVRYAEYILKVRAGQGTYPLELRPDPRNTRTKPTSAGTKPILMPESVGEVYPFRYVEVEGLDPEGECRFVRTAVNYPFDESASSFDSPDTVLNAVWDLCRYSIKATSFCGCYVDGDRERIPYEADALINQLAHYGVDREYAMARRSAEFLFSHPTWPTEWQLQCVLIAWYDYLYTGDKALIEKWYDLLKAKTLLALREPCGLISTRTGKMSPEFYASLNYTGEEPIKDIVDWPRSGSFGVGKAEAGEADGYVLETYNTVVNAYHYEALVLMGRIARALGRRADAAGFDRRAAEVCDAVNALLFDPAAGCYRDGLRLDPSGAFGPSGAAVASGSPGAALEPVAHCSLHSNMFPLAFGMVPAERRQSVLDFIRSRGMGCSVYGSQFLLDALYDAFDADYALSLLASTSIRSWYNMIRIGSTVTLEAWDPCFKKNLDWNHAWGAAPADIIPRKLVGVEPLEPGFRRMRIRPQPGPLAWFSATVPTLRGPVRVDWREEGAAGPGASAASSGPGASAASLGPVGPAASGLAAPGLTASGRAPGACRLTVDIPSGIRTEVWLRIPAGPDSSALPASAPSGGSAASALPASAPSGLALPASAPSGLALTIDGKPFRRFELRDGFVVFPLRPGRHVCRLSNSL